MVESRVTTLDDLLDRAVEGVAGARAAAIGGLDGLLVEQRPAAAVDLTATVAELAGAIAALDRALGAVAPAGAGEPGAGAAIAALTVDATSVSVHVARATERHYVLLLTDRGAGPDDARRVVAEAAREVGEMVG